MQAMKQLCFMYKIECPKDECPKDGRDYGNKLHFKGDVDA